LNRLEGTARRLRTALGLNALPPEPELPGTLEELLANVKE
jgi:hypothetical protein